MSHTPHTGSDQLVLAIHPTSRGFGWVLFEGPDTAVDWGIASAREGRNTKLLRRFDRLLNRYEPDAVVLEAFEARDARRSVRVQTLCREMQHRAHCLDIETPVYRHVEVQSAFALVGARTRYEIADSIGRQVPALNHRMPKKRRPWESEDPRQSLFDAAALAVAHFAYNDAV